MGATPQGLLRADVVASWSVLRKAMASTPGVTSHERYLEDGELQMLRWWENERNNANGEDGEASSGVCSMSLRPLAPTDATVVFEQARFLAPCLNLWLNC